MSPMAHPFACTTVRVRLPDSSPQTQWRSVGLRSRIRHSLKSHPSRSTSSRFLTTVWWVWVTRRCRKVGRRLHYKILSARANCRLEYSHFGSIRKLSQLKSIKKFTIKFKSPVIRRRPTEVKWHSVGRMRRITRATSPGCPSPSNATGSSKSTGNLFY